MILTEETRRKTPVLIKRQLEIVAELVQPFFSLILKESGVLSPTLFRYKAGCLKITTIHSLEKMTMKNG